jgi:hypothetical protein
MKIDAGILRGIDLKTSPPILVAKFYYDMQSDIPFLEDLDDYLMHHCVVSRPTCFAMARLINLAKDGEPEEPAWFIRFAYGNLLELLSVLPAYLPKICWCRNEPGKAFDNKMRIYSLDRLVKLANRRQKT